jgi:hypothetical protein
MIQREWKNHILRKKIWCMLKPNHEMSIARRTKETDAINGGFERIHVKSTNFKTLVITYNDDQFDIKKIFINYKQNNMYTIYEENDEQLFLMNRKQIGNKLKGINNVLSIKLEAVVAHQNFYGYPEIMQVKYF